MSQTILLTKLLLEFMRCLQNNKFVITQVQI